MYIGGGRVVAARVRAQLNFINRMHIGYVFNVRSFFSEAASRRDRLRAPPAPSRAPFPPKDYNFFHARDFIFFNE